MNKDQNKVFLQSNIKLFVASVLFIICIPSVAQEDFHKFAIKIIMKVENGDLENALITITKNGKADRVIDPNKGKDFVDLDLDAEYRLVYTKMGYVTKTIIIDTHVPNGREKEKFAKFTATVKLDKQAENKVITYSQPVGSIKYSVAFGDFVYHKRFDE
jgi:hypothetical protein